MYYAIGGLFMALVGGIAVAIMVLGKNPAKFAQLKKELYFRAYNFLARFFITSSEIHKIYLKLANLCLYSRRDLQKMTVVLFFQSWGLAIGLIVIGITQFGDMLSILCTAAFALIMRTCMVDKRLDKQHYALLRAMRDALSRVHEEYMKTNSVVEAVENAQVADILKRPFDEITAVLTATDGALRMQEFYAATPFRVLQTFVGVCYNINTFGDATPEETGGLSSFSSAITTLISDVNAEIAKIELQRSMFGMIEWLPFVPFLCINVIESYFTGIMPGTALIYGGPIGFVCRTVTLLVSLVCYKVLSGINSVTPIKLDDRPMWVRTALDNPLVRKFIEDAEPKGASRLKMRKMLVNAMSKQSPEEVYFQKMLYAGVCFVFALLLSFFAIQMGGDFVRNNTSQLSLTASNEMDAYSKDSILQLDERYIAQRDALQPVYTLTDELKIIGIKLRALYGLGPKYVEEEVDLSDDAIFEMVKGYMPGLTDLQAQDQVSRLRDKYASVKGASFHWWLVFVCAGFALVGYMVPEMLLMLRMYMIRIEIEDDFLQLQTLVQVLMVTQMDTLDILYELARQSSVHKGILTYCYHAFPSNPDLELVRLQSKTSLAEFKRFVGKLRLTVADLSLHEAFFDLELEREQVMRSREIKTEASLQSRRQIGGVLALAPVVLLVIAELVIPLGYLGLKSFAGMFASMDSL